MERAGFVLKVKRDRLDEYKRRHREVWPDMLDAIRRNGFRNYSLFLDEAGNLFGYVEAEESFEKCLEGMATEEANLRWQADMADFFEGISGRPDQSMMKLEHVLLFAVAAADQDTMRPTAMRVDRTTPLRMLRRRPGG